MRAVWNERVVVECDDTVVVEGNHYFPSDSVRPEHLGASDTHSRSFWKGIARYYDLKVGDRVPRSRLAIALEHQPEKLRVAEHGVVRAIDPVGRQTNRDPCRC